MYIPFFIFGPILLVTAFIFSRVWLRSKRITDQGQIATAIVKDVVSSSTVDSSLRAGGDYSAGGRFFKPVFEWTVNGQTYQKTHNAGQDPPKYRVGQEVNIYYDPANPAEMTLEGSGKVTKILMLSFGAGGVLLLLLGVLVWI